MTSRLSRRRFLQYSAAIAFAGNAGATTRVRQGVLQGQSAGGVRVFKGVPFAEPPVGALRFLPPKKRAAWNGEREAIRFAPAAMQPGSRDATGLSEDCLYLNVWTPEARGPHPVLVWIHGGGFTAGRSSDPLTDGTVFARDGIVCVTVAYRLGVLGFLDVGPLLGEKFEGSANNAVLDLLMALEWVQENIEAFGGDPSRVTVGGESAGAKLTDILMGVPAARPLFHQMISQSGGAERVWSRADSATVARGFGDVWGKGSTGDLRTAQAESLIKAQHTFLAQWPQHFPLRVEVDGNVIPQVPLKSIADGASRGKRLLIGTNRDESSLFIGPHPAHDAVAGDLGNMTLDRYLKVFGHYRAVYPELTDEQLRIRALSAEEYWIPSIQAADAHVHGGGEAWMYRLDFSETSGRLQQYAYHSLDLRLVWNKAHADVKNAESEARLAQQVHQAWVSFIRGETPGANGLPRWLPYRRENRETLIIDSESRMEMKPQSAELRLWS